ncbi:reverse transcriptase domain-containing protein [Tanacetum coccineum]
MPEIDDEETLILEEESRSKMSEKEKDPEVIIQNISHKPIDYEKLNRLSDDFGKRFTPQQELSAEQAFWLCMSNPTSKPSDASPVKIEAPKELPKVSLVNESLIKLKFHLARCDNVVKIRTTPDARTEGKEIVENVVHTPSATTIAPGMFKLDLVNRLPSIQVMQNRNVHIDYLRHTQEQANTLRELVEQAKAKQPLDRELDFACKYTTRIQEFLVYVQDTCLIAVTPSTKKIVNAYLDSGCSIHMTRNRSQLKNFVSKFLGTVRFGNNQIARIIGYDDYQLENIVISRVYYVEGLGHNLFSVGQFCDADLEVAFWKNSCFIRNLEGVDLLSGPETQICTQFLLMTCLNHLRSAFYPKLQRVRAGYGIVDYLISTLVGMKRISTKRTKTKPKRTKPSTEWKEREKVKVKAKKSTKQSTKSKSKVKDEADTEEILNGPTRTHLMGRVKTVKCMRTRSSSNLVAESSPNPTTSNPKRRNRRRSKQPISLEESPLDTMADQRTMADMLYAPTEGYAEAIVVLLILAEHFELNHSLINMMTSNQFFGLEKDNPHDHIHLVSKFINEFFLPSRTTNLRNEISKFQQRFDESFHEAWDRYKDLLRACPHHGFTKLHQLDNFYNALNLADQDSLNSAVGGNLLVRRTQDVLTIIENKSKVRNSRNKSIVSQVKSSDVNSSSSEIAKLTHAVNQ